MSEKIFFQRQRRKLIEFERRVSWRNRLFDEDVESRYEQVTKLDDVSFSVVQLEMSRPILRNEDKRDTKKIGG